MDVENLSHLNGYYNGPINNPEMAFNDIAATSANTVSSEFISYLLQVLFTGLPPPDPLVLKALTHDPHCFLSHFPNSASAVVFDSLGLSNDERNNSHSRRISTTVMRIFSPIRKKSRRLRKISTQQSHTRIFRPSTTSLPAKMMQMTVDPGARDEHRWSMLQLAMDGTNPPPPAPSQSHQPLIVPSVITSTSEASKRTKETLDTPSGVTETVENAYAVSGVSVNQGTASPLVQSSPVVQRPSTPTVFIDETQIVELKKNVQRLEAAIQKIELRKTGNYSTIIDVIAGSKWDQDLVWVK
ncbi:hypothetical protein ACTXT7_005661 [Hymenolepis weldensis]